MSEQLRVPVEQLRFLAGVHVGRLRVHVGRLRVHVGRLRVQQSDRLRDLDH